MKRKKIKKNKINEKKIIEVFLESLTCDCY